MKNFNQIGVWIDNKKAIVVTLNNGNETVEIIQSGIEKRNRIEGEGKQYTRMGNQFSDFEKVEEKKFEQAFKAYLKVVIDTIKDAGSIVILGPADAKVRLHKAISKSGELLDKVKLVETADSMTDNQIVALIKSRYN